MRRASVWCFALVARGSVRGVWGQSPGSAVPWRARWPVWVVVRGSPPGQIGCRRSAASGVVRAGSGRVYTLQVPLSGNLGATEPSDADESRSGRQVSRSGKPARVYALQTPARTTCRTRPPTRHDPTKRTSLNDARTSHDQPSPRLRHWPTRTRTADGRRPRSSQTRTTSRVEPRRNGLVTANCARNQHVPFDEGDGLYMGEAGHRSAPRTDGGAR